MVKYEKPELELVEFLAVDVITVSILDGEEIGGNIGEVPGPDEEPF